MKRRTVTVEVEFEGITPDPQDLCAQIERVRCYGIRRVLRAEVVEEKDE